MKSKEINQKLNFIKFNMEMEGFDIPKDLEEEGKKILLGEIEGDTILQKYIEKAKK